MDKREALKFLEDLTEKIKAMTPEEFAARERELGVDKLVYDPAKYMIPFCTRPDDLGCHAHFGKHCFNAFQCPPTGETK